MKNLVATLLLLPLTALPVLADVKSGNDKVRSGPLETPPEVIATPARQDPTIQFIESNVTETLYHEFAHALIDILDLPVFGPEEFAADLFSVILINRLHDEATAQRIARDVAYAYKSEEVNIENAGERHAMWDTHGSNMQRYYNLACLFYGASPDARADLAEDLRLPENRAETCVDEFEMANHAWGDVLEGLGSQAPGQSIKMDWILDSESHLTRFVQSEVERLNALYVLPRELVVSVIPCGEVNAFYDSGAHEIIMCTELSDYLDDAAP